jgi:hypothetical protein
LRRLKDGTDWKRTHMRVGVDANTGELVVVRRFSDRRYFHGIIRCCGYSNQDVRILDGRDMPTIHEDLNSLLTGIFGFENRYRNCVIPFRDLTATKH